MDWNKPANSLKCKSWLKVVESSDQMIPFSFIEADSVPGFLWIESCEIWLILFKSILARA